jgi:hypothetical protein
MCLVELVWVARDGLIYPLGFSAECLCHARVEHHPFASDFKYIGSNGPHDRHSIVLHNLLVL